MWPQQVIGEVLVAELSQGPATLRGMPSDSPFARLPEGLPAGSLVVPDPQYADEMWAGCPALWVSDERLSDAGRHWSRLFDLREQTGLYPLLLNTLEDQPSRPWHDGELSPASVGAIDLLTADGVLRRFWDSVAEEDSDEGAVESDIPNGRWPGLASPGTSDRDADAAARRVAGELGAAYPWLVGLVPADRGADALTVVGWGGPCDHTNETQEISVVVRSWEERFGARVVAVGFDTLELSVATPPTTIEHARQVAIEHHAFGPDNIWQEVGSFEEYAKGLVGSDRWWFWWD
jgi:hypothetical protein